MIIYSDKVLIPRRYSAFFLEYQEKFTANFLHICGLVSPSGYGKEDLQVFARMVWESICLFESPESLHPGAKAFAKSLEVKVALAKTVFLTIYDFTYYLFARESSLKTLQETVSYLGSYIEAFEQLDTPSVQPAALSEPDTNVPSDECVMQELKHVVTAGSSLHMHVLYQEVIISLPVRVANVGNQNMRIGLQAIHSLPLKAEGKAFFTSDKLSKAVRGRLEAIDLDSLEAVVGGLIYTEHSPNKREAVRVKPDTQVPVLVNCNGQDGQGLLVDLSVTGVCIELLTPMPMAPEDPIGISFQLENKQTRYYMAIQTYGKVLTVRESFPPKVIAKIVPDTKNEIFISQYIAQRQLEIIRDVQQITEKKP